MSYLIRQSSGMGSLWDLFSCANPANAAGCFAGGMTASVTPVGGSAGSATIAELVAPSQWYPNTPVPPPVGAPVANLPDASSIDSLLSQQMTDWQAANQQFFTDVSRANPVNNGPTLFGIAMWVWVLIGAAAFLILRKL